ncbi:hypothetical protein [Rhizobium sp. Root482]|uniref:hypothetical protein n=1 Tax=Rhizobium sp. Root482 TaxID=1736543 RepID=UPI0006FCFD76|nr:hypothetical protein [Rhizobium sp. Root482]KQY19901.1 hypothetical protein ASD31_05790 [Rhizobium sp. Root482]
MSSTLRIRQIHRWLSILFTIAVLINIAAMTQGEPALWIGLLALFPLLLLLLTGLVLFALPYLAGAQRSRAADHG